LKRRNFDLSAGKKDFCQRLLSSATLAAFPMLNGCPIHSHRKTGPADKWEKAVQDHSLPLPNQNLSRFYRIFNPLINDYLADFISL